ncbi:unnamed protein product [Nezara viridula]|uniref:Uncharacterized protein n=1 Tax=Nezara viridula TaxID=85310 RepID=A0A9P0HC83_NEZVI|nr:unnamed protein product [Nezara viridula]
MAEGETKHPLDNPQGQLGRTLFHGNPLAAMLKGDNELVRKHVLSTLRHSDVLQEHQSVDTASSYSIDTLTYC